MVQILIAIGVIVVAVYIVHKRRDTDDSPPTRDTDQRDLLRKDDSPTSATALPTFKVVALGVAGSGKTVLLASMFHHLNVQRSGDVYYLKAPADQRVELAQVFGEIANPNRPWPPGTSRGDMREYTFDCSAHFDGDEYDVLRISYIDYAGEHLERIRDGNSAKLRELQRNIREASALLGIVDGHRVLQFLRDEPEGHEYFHARIQPMIGFMADARCPLHFVLTKWDLVRGFGEPPDASDELRLELVADALEPTKIEALAKSPQRSRRTVRVIPVSAVGPDYARVDPTGRVVKRTDGRLRPTNLAVPLAAVVPDLFRQIEAALDEEALADLENRIGADGRRTPAERLASLRTLLSVPVGIALRVVIRQVIAGGYANDIADAFVDWMRRPDARRRADAEELRATEEHRLDTTRRVRALVLRDFETTVDHFTATMPSSLLSNR